MCNTSGSGTDLPCPSGDVAETHGPLPHNTSLFMGFAFMLTASSESDRISNKVSSDEEEGEAETCCSHILIFSRAAERFAWFQLLEGSWGEHLTLGLHQSCPEAFHTFYIKHHRRYKTLYVPSSWKTPEKVEVLLKWCQMGYVNYIT